MHIAGLGFHGDCRLKPPPGTYFFQQLAEQILTDGFCTNEKPLLVCQSRDRIMAVNTPWAVGNTPCLPAFSVAHAKGMVHATAVLAILHRAWKLNLALKHAQKGSV